MSEQNYEYKTYPDKTEKNPCLGTIGLKATRPVLILAVLGVFCLCFVHALFGILMGVFLLVLSCSVWFLQKDKKVLDVYEDALYLFEDGNEHRAICLPIDEIREWSVNRGNNYAIVLTTVDDQQFMAHTFQVSKTVRLLNLILEEKSLEYLRMEQIRSMRKGKKK